MASTQQKRNFDWDKYPTLGLDGKPVDFYGRPYFEDLR